MHVALQEINLYLAKNVPRLRDLVGATLGSPCVTVGTFDSTSSLVTPGLRVVGGTGFEPVTPTMSR